MLFQTYINNEYIYLLDNYWGKAYFGGFKPGSNESLKTRGVDIPRSIICNGNEYEVIEILESALVCTYFLKNITIPDTIKKIGDYSLYRCSKELKELDLPNSIISIGAHAFEGCSSLMRVTLPNRLDIIPSNCFYGCDSLLTINLPNGLLKISEFAFYACKGFTNIIIPDSVVEIGRCAFAFCYGIKSFTLPKNLLYLSVNTFLQNSQIEQIISLNPIPPQIIKEKFDKFPINHYFQNAKLYVPKGSLQAYRKSEDWNVFYEIAEL